MAFSQPFPTAAYRPASQRPTMMAPNLSTSLHATGATTTATATTSIRPFPSTPLPVEGHVELHAQLDDAARVYEHPSISTTSSFFAPRMVHSEVITDRRVIRDIVEGHHHHHHHHRHVMSSSSSSSSFPVQYPQNLSYYDDRRQPAAAAVRSSSSLPADFSVPAEHRSYIIRLIDECNAYGLDEESTVAHALFLARAMRDGLDVYSELQRRIEQDRRQQQGTQTVAAAESSAPPPQFSLKPKRQEIGIQAAVPVSVATMTDPPPPSPPRPPPPPPAVRQWVEDTATPSVTTDVTSSRESVVVLARHAAPRSSTSQAGAPHRRNSATSQQNVFRLPPHSFASQALHAPSPSHRSQAAMQQLSPPPAAGGVSSPTKALSAEEQALVAERLLATSTHSSRQRHEARLQQQQQKLQKAKQQQKVPKTKSTVYLGIANTGVPYQIASHQPVTCARPRPTEPIPLSRSTLMAPPPPFTSPPLVQSTSYPSYNGKVTHHPHPHQEASHHSSSVPKRSQRWAEGESPLVAPRRKKSTTTTTTDVGLEVSPSRREASTQGEPAPYSPQPRHLDPVQLAALESSPQLRRYLEATQSAMVHAQAVINNRRMSPERREQQRNHASSYSTDAGGYHPHLVTSPPIGSGRDTTAVSPPFSSSRSAVAVGGLPSSVVPLDEEHYDAPLRPTATSNPRNAPSSVDWARRGTAAASSSAVSDPMLATHHYGTTAGSEATRSLSRVSSLTNQDY